MTDRPTAIRVHDEYQAMARDYDSRWRDYLSASVEQTLQRIPETTPADILDVGCGTGVLLEALAKRFPEARLSGIDPVAEMLAVARKRLPQNINLQQSQAENLPFADNSFDLVTGSSMFHYVTQPRGTLAEVHRVLRPGGQLLITDWCRDYFSMTLLNLYLRARRQPLHRIWRSHELRTLITDAGFTGIHVQRYRLDWLWGMMSLAATRP